MSCGKIIKLSDIVGRLSDFDEDDTIYVAEPWTEDSNAMVATAPDESTVTPKAAAKAGLTYFIEIFIASNLPSPHTMRLSVPTRNL